MELWELNRGPGVKQDHGHSDTAMPAVPPRTDVVAKQSSVGSLENTGPPTCINPGGSMSPGMGLNVSSAGPPGHPLSSGMQHINVGGQVLISLDAPLLALSVGPP